MLYGDAGTCIIKKQNTLVCQFASPLDVDTHTTILEGKYWKRRAEAVIAEYKKWRMFHIMRLLGKGDTSVQDTMFQLSGFQMSDMDTVDSQCSDLAGNMLTDEDYLNFMSDTLFSTISSHQPFAFPDCREIARGASLADFIQPSLGPLQPNLDDFMDTLEPLQDLLLSTTRLPPVPEESMLPSEDPMYRSSMSIDSYNQPSYISSSHNTTTSTMPTSQMTIHGTNNNTQIMPISQQSKNEQIRIYSNERLYSESEMSNNMLDSQEMLPTFSQATYDGQTSNQPEQIHGNIYPSKSGSVQYLNAPHKILQQTEYSKYAAVPPSQTAPETVSLLQQPVQNVKYASTVVIQGRGGYTREKARPRLGHYNVPMTSSQYQGYSQPVQCQAHVPQSLDSRPVQGVRQTSSQIQYLQPAPADFKIKPSASVVNTRSFKLPSPPLAPATSQQVQVAPGPSVVSTSAIRGKEQFRSHSLPLGSQITSDWVVTGPASGQDRPATHNARGRESNSGAIRLRSRSSSGGPTDGSASGSTSVKPNTLRRPPPLTSVASEPALPQASVMLAQLLSAQHSQSLYKLNSSAEDISKAAMLQKGAEYIKQLKAERNQIKEEMESLRQQIECLNNSISVVSAALVESYSACVSSSSGADLVRTTLLWAEQHCSLVEMRP
ncbi:unnamed protein product, partial [Leptidea sinapis]